MRMYDIIHKKREGGELTREELRFFCPRLHPGEIPDYQASAPADGHFLRGMTRRETGDLTLEMAGSGDRVDLSTPAGGEGGQALHRGRGGQDLPDHRAHCRGLRGDHRQDERPGPGPHRRHRGQAGEHPRPAHGYSPPGVLRHRKADGAFHHRPVGEPVPCGQEALRPAGRDRHGGEPALDSPPASCPRRSLPGRTPSCWT